MQTRNGTDALALVLAGTASISAARLRAHVSMLASDAFEGRGPATAGIHRAANYLESELKSLGLEPLFGDRYRQPFDLTVAATLGPENALTQGGARPFLLSRDFAPFLFSASGSVKGSLIFAGYGITSKDLGYDDYGAIEAAGKIVVILSGEPGEDDEKSPFDGRRLTPHASLRAKVVRAREAKALAVLIVRDSLADARTHGESYTDAGILALKVTKETATLLLGFDPMRLKRQIDRSYRPKTRPGIRSPALIKASIVYDHRTVDNIGALLTPKTATSTESVLIGAHYDHLGLGGPSSLSGSDAPEIHNGADDNASGTSVVLEVARSLKSDPRTLRRRVAFVLFAGEESGLLGSAHFIKHAPFELSSLAAMINLDMVGRLRDRNLNVMGTKTGAGLEALARRLVSSRGLEGSYGGDGYGPSDHTSFYSNGTPVLFLFTGAHENYHKPNDDTETLNYTGMAEVAAVTADLVRALSFLDPRPAYQSAPAPPSLAGGGGYGPYFGSIPDFGDQKDGVRLAGVRAGSPAERAGVQKGDVITRFHGITIKNLEDLTVALRSSAPGDEVEVELARGDARLKVRAKLEKRQ